MNIIILGINKCEILYIQYVTVVIVYLPYQNQLVWRVWSYPLVGGVLHDLFYDPLNLDDYHHQVEIDQVVVFSFYFVPQFVFSAKNKKEIKSNMNSTCHKNILIHYFYTQGVIIAMIIGYYDLQLPMQSVHITAVVL